MNKNDAKLPCVQRLKRLTIYPAICKKYGKSSKIDNNFLFLFSNEILCIRAGNHKIVVIKANREDPDQTASSEAI